MIKNYNQFINESLLNHLKGPSNEEILEYMLNDIKERNLPLIYLLFKSIQDNFLFGVKYAIEHGVDINEEYYYQNYERTPLLFAVFIGHRINIIKFLIKNGADVNAKNGFALSIASEYGELNVAKILIDNGADVHSNNANAINNASRKHLNVVQYLINNGADIHNNNDLPLILAVQHNKADIVQLLLENGADIHTLNDRAIKICLTIYKDIHYPTLKVLLENGADLKVIPQSDLEYIFKHKHPMITDLIKQYLKND